jgi:hypothetical protein
MELTLHHPLQISSRLLPAVHVGDAWISIEPGGVAVGGRLEWNWHIDIGAGAVSWSGGELSTGPQHTDNEEGYRQAMGALLAFLMDAAEQYRHDSDYDDPSFSTAVVHWAYQNDDELGMMLVEIEEGPDRG